MANIVADDAFLERRLRGLVRFMNALMRHPVLKNDPLVVSFLTEPVVSLKGIITYPAWPERTCFFFLYTSIRLPATPVFCFSFHVPFFFFELLG